MTDYDPVSAAIAEFLNPPLTTAAGVAGMTLRDWFAGQALAGLLAYPDGGNPGNSMEQHTTHHAEVAYSHADAMVAERAKCLAMEPIDTSAGGIEP